MVKTAIIVATDKRAEEKIFGIPLVKRSVLMAVQAGLSVHVLGQVQSLFPVLSDLISEKAFVNIKNQEDIQEVVNDLDLSSEDGIIVMKACQVINRMCLKELMNAGKTPGSFYMKPHNDDNDKGLYLVNSDHVVPVITALWSSDKMTGDFDKTSMQIINGPPGLPTIIRHSSEAIKEAESRLVSALAAQTEGEDGFLARHIDRPVSHFISQRLSHTPVTPNMITLIGVTIGLAGAYFLAQPGYGERLLGSLLFLICVIVDGVDGEVARLTLKESVFGHYLDVVTDNIVHAAIFIAVPLGLYRETGNDLYLTALWLMLGGFGLCLITVYQCILRRNDKELAQSPKIVRFMALMTNRDFAYLIVLLALIDQLSWFVVGTAAGTYVFAFTLWIVYLSEKTRNRDVEM